MALGEVREEEDIAVVARGEVLLWNILREEEVDA